MSANFAHPHSSSRFVRVASAAVAGVMSIVAAACSDAPTTPATTFKTALPAPNAALVACPPYCVVNQGRILYTDTTGFGTGDSNGRKTLCV